MRINKCVNQNKRASLSENVNNIPSHVAIIMDGNGRWAQSQSQERLYGHSFGIESVRDAVKGALELGIKYLTIYAFSTENWARPKDEVEGLMSLFGSTIAKEVAPLAKEGVKLDFMGDLDGLPTEVRSQIEASKSVKIEKVNLTLIIALNYSARWEITQAAKKIAMEVKNGSLKVEDISENTINEHLAMVNVPDPELMIRTSGEIRLSNFMLWQLSYSELIFTDILWPDFNKDRFKEAINVYLSRVRRFGKI